MEAPAEAAAGATPVAGFSSGSCSRHTRCPWDTLIVTAPGGRRGRGRLVGVRVSAAQDWPGPPGPAPTRASDQRLLDWGEMESFDRRRRPGTAASRLRVYG